MYNQSLQKLYFHRLPPLQLFASPWQGCTPGLQPNKKNQLQWIPSTAGTHSCCQGTFSGTFTHSPSCPRGVSDAQRPLCTSTVLAAIPGCFLAKPGCSQTCALLLPGVTCDIRCLSLVLSQGSGGSCRSQNAAQVTEGLPGTHSDGGDPGKSISISTPSSFFHQKKRGFQSPCLRFWLQMECRMIPVGKQK